MSAKGGERPPEPLSLREREGPAAKRWEGEWFHRQPANPKTFNLVFDALEEARHAYPS
jgi:hypothetical protein